MKFARAAPPAYDKKGNCYAGRKQTNYLIRWTQANKKLSNRLTIINRHLEGQPSGLQSGFALHLVQVSSVEYAVRAMRTRLNAD